MATTNTSTGVPAWTGFRGLRTYQPVLQADLRDLDEFLKNLRKYVGQLFSGDPVSNSTTVVITNDNAEVLGANPSAQVTLTVQNGVLATYMRSDAAPRLDISISPTGVEAWTGTHAWTPSLATTTPITINAHADQEVHLFDIFDPDGGAGVHVDELGLVGINIEDPTAMLAIQGAETGGPPIAGPIAWWFAESLGAPSTGSTVATWTDSTGNGYTLTGTGKRYDGAASAALPKYYPAGDTKALTNLPCVDFPIIDPNGLPEYSHFSIASTLSLNRSAGYTIGIIRRNYDNSLSNSPYFLGNTGLSNSDFVRSLGTGASLMNWVSSSGGGDLQFMSNYAWTPGNDSEYAVLRVAADPTSGTMQGWTDGVETSGAGSMTDVTMSFNLVGAHVDSGTYTGCYWNSIAEIIVYDRELTDQEVDDLNVYLAARVAGSIVANTTTLDLVHLYDIDETLVSRFDEDGHLGIGVDPSYPLHVRNATAPQAGIDYDSSNYFTMSVGATGAVTFNAVGAGAAFTFSDAVTASSTLTVTGTTTLNAPVTITSTTSPQLTTRYDASNHFTAAVSSAGAVTFNATGASAGFTFSDAVVLSSTLNVTGVSTLGIATVSDYVEMTETSAPSTPASNKLRVYAKDANGVSNLYFKRDDGVEINLSKGAIVSDEWRFNTSTSAADPGAGKLAFNSATIASITAIYIDDVSLTNIDVTVIIELLQAGDQLLVQDSDDASKHIRFELSGAPTDSTGYWTLPVTYVAHSGTLFTNNERLDVAGFLAGGTGGAGGNLDDLDDVTITTPADGDVLTYDSGSGEWINAEPTGGGGGGGDVTVTTTDLVVGTVLLDSLLSGTQASFTVADVDDGAYDYIDIEMVVRTDRSNTGDAVVIGFNSDTTATNYAYARINNNNGSAVNGAVADDRYIGWCTAANSDANYFGTLTIRVNNPNSAKNKQAYGFSSRRADNATFYQDIQSVMWENTAAITDITLAPLIGPNFVAGSRCIITGYKEQAIVTDVTGGGGGTDFLVVQVFS